MIRVVTGHELHSKFSKDDEGKLVIMGPNPHYFLRTCCAIAQVTLSLVIVCKLFGVFG